MGILLAMGPVWGLLGTTVAMYMGFRKIGAAGAGAGATSEMLANEIGLALTTTIVGFVALPIGIVVIVLNVRSLAKSNNPDRPPSPTP